MNFSLENVKLRAGWMGATNTHHTPNHLNVGASKMAEVEASTKRCNKCKQFLPLAAFTVDRSRPDGLRKMCRECVRPYYNYRKIVEERKVARAADPASFRAKDREYYHTRMAVDPAFKQGRYEAGRRQREADPVAYRAYLREYTQRKIAQDPEGYRRKRHERYVALSQSPGYAEKRRESERRRRESPEYRAARKEYQRRHREKYPEKKLAIKHNRRQRELKAPGRGVTAAEWRELVESSCGICSYCNQRRPLSLDHIDAIANDGAHDVENLAPACISCNSQKHTTPLLVWMARRRLSEVLD